MMSLKRTLDRLMDSGKIVTPRYLKFLAEHGDDPYPPWVVDVIAEQLKKTPRDRSGTFSAASAGACLRAQELEYLGAGPTDLTGEVSPGLMAIFKDGKWRHLKWQADLLAAGIIEEIEYSAPWRSKRAVGTLDGLGVVPDTHGVGSWRGELFGAELKGVNAWQYPKLVSAPYPKEDHMRQVHRYFVLTGVRLFSVIYENKSTQNFHERVVRPIPRLLDESRQELEELNRAVERKELHRILAPCRHRSGKQWEGCKFSGEDGPCESAGTWL